MRLGPTAIRIGALALGLLFGAPRTAHGQAPRVSPSAVTALPREQAASDLRQPRVDLSEWSRHAGWGAAIGAGVGLAYGLAVERGGLTGLLEVAADMVIGFTAGLVAGTAVYAARLALGR